MTEYKFPGLDLEELKKIDVEDEAPTIEELRAGIRIAFEDYRRKKLSAYMCNQKIEFYRDQLDRLDMQEVLIEERNRHYLIVNGYHPKGTPIHGEQKPKQHSYDSLKSSSNRD